jgi:hypothetical protein
MKVIVTKSKLRQIVREELKNTMQEGWWPFGKKKEKEEAAPESTEPEAAVGAVPEGLSDWGRMVYKDEDPERAYALYQGQLEGYKYSSDIQNPKWWPGGEGPAGVLGAIEADHDPQYKLNLGTEGRGPELARAFDSMLASIESNAQTARADRREFDKAARSFRTDDPTSAHRRRKNRRR